MMQYGIVPGKPAFFKNFFCLKMKSYTPEIVLCRRHLMGNIMNNKEIRRIEDFIKTLGERELIYLNRLVIERLKLLSQERSTTQMMKFNIGEKVSFTTPDGIKKTGIISKINKKTASVDTNDGGYWNVAPGLLMHE